MDRCCERHFRIERIMKIPTVGLRWAAPARRTKRRHEARSSADRGRSVDPTPHPADASYDLGALGQVRVRAGSIIASHYAQASFDSGALYDQTLVGANQHDARRLPLPARSIRIVQPSGILHLARRRICAAARDAYRRYFGRALDASVYTVLARRLPGLDFDRRRRNVFDDIGAENADRELFRGVVEGGR